MTIWSWESNLGAPRAFATCCRKRQERMAKGKKQKTNGKWFFQICGLPFAICHLKFSLLITLLVAASLTQSACHKKSAAVHRDPLLEAYDTEQDWNDPQHMIALNYQQAQGKRVFYSNCVWCHADATPAGPSNRSNLTPNPPLLNDGTTLNGVSDEFMQNIITLGGSAMGKSAMMPPWGLTLRPDEIRAAIAFARAIAQPPYKPSLRSGPQYSVK
jgi:mono/diheme cytochrome c family protein